MAMFFGLGDLSMIKFVALLLVAVPLLAACETSDWMADPDDASYVPYEQQNTYDAQADTDAVIAHERAVNAENCAAAAEGRDRVCYDD